YTLSATDPSSADRAAGLTYTINWGDGSPVQTVSPTANNYVSVKLTHVYTTAGTYTASLTATDKDGGVSTPVTRTETVLAVTSATLQTVIARQGSLTFQETSDPLAQTLVGAVNGLVAQTGVSSVNVTNGGSGYTAAPAVTFSAPQQAGGTTATGTAT